MERTPGRRRRPAPKALAALVKHPGTRRLARDGQVTEGAKLHVCGFAGDGMHILDVWESEQAFNTFVEQRVGPAVAEVGIEGQPDVKFFPTHGIFAPALGRGEQVSSI